MDNKRDGRRQIMMGGRPFTMISENGKAIRYEPGWKEERQASKQGAAEPLTEAEVDRARWIQLMAQATTPPAHIEIVPPRPSADDVRLAQTWAGSEGHVHRMLSARLAELAVAKHYVQRGHEVIDIAITQLDRDEAAEWKTHDLLVDGRPIDVKNATRSQKNHTRYVSHCVPKFKEDRNRREVAIAAAISYWASEETLRVSPGPVLFLGTVKLARIEALQEMLAGGPLGITFKRGNVGPKFLPPWLFAYGPDHYTKQQAALKALAALPPHTMDDTPWQAKSRVPLLLAINKPIPKGEDAGTTALEVATINALERRTKRHGLALDVIFLTILEQFLLALKEGQTFEQDAIRSAVFANHSNWPLFVYDPLLTIDALLETLQKAFNLARRELLSFRYFELVNLNILRGKRQYASSWTTLLAYCGGWHDGKPCGQTPLVFGLHDSCHCRHLICDQCGFCSTACPQSDTHRSL